MKRDEIAEIIKESAFSSPSYEELPEFVGRFTSKILSTLTRDFEVVDESHLNCPLHHKRKGTITRQATWEEIIEIVSFFVDQEHNYLLKSGGRLRVKT